MITVIVISLSPRMTIRENGYTLIKVTHTLNEVCYIQLVDEIRPVGSSELLDRQNPLRCKLREHLLQTLLIVLAKSPALIDAEEHILVAIVPPVPHDHLLQGVRVVCVR